MKFVCKFCVDSSFLIVIYLGVSFPGHMIIILNPLGTGQAVSKNVLLLLLLAAGEAGL